MVSTSRSRVRLHAATGLAAVVASIGAVTWQAPAANAADAAGPVAIPGLADVIKPPAGSRPIGAYLVFTGTQNYTCVVAPGATAGAYSGAAVPEAQLVGTGGRLHHFAGPSWQSERDGSLVTATKVAASARTGAIPELLLKVVTHSGHGVLDRADYINRLYTSGGVPPTSACTAGETVKVPYKAVYVFWDAPAA